MASTASSDGGYIRGKASAGVHESHHHVMPVSTYLKVFGALMVLTVLTVLISYASLGSASFMVAMLVALVKAGLVVGFFMHLKYDTRFHSFVFFSTLLFVAIFFALTFFDINTRSSVRTEFGQTYEVRDSGVIDARPTVTKPLSDFTPEEIEHIKHAIEVRERALEHAHQ